MKIICDRCEKEITDVETRRDWLHIETSEKGYNGKIGENTCLKIQEKEENLKPEQ